MFDRIRRRPDASTLFEGARAALDEGRFDEARDGFERAIAAGLDTPDAWFNLGLVHKLERRWAESVRCSRRAAELDPEFREAHWNLGVAATAMRDWASARWAWRGLGIAVGDGEVPTADFGLSPVRLNPDAGAEVVWGVRIDPCRMRVESVPLPESGHRWHDVVLHDVVPRGQRLLDGRPVSVFDELLRMDPSDEATHVLVVSAPGEGSRDALAATLAEAGLGVEDWTESIEMLCATCSLGEAHEHRDDGEVVAVWAQRRRLGVAGATTRVEELADAWRRAEPGRAIESLEAVGE